MEPFCGGIAVTLGLAPRRALLNDANPHLVNFYRWAQRGLRIDVEMENDKRLYYRHRSRFNEMLAESRHDTREAAALFYFLNRTGYNGLCRFNRDGAFNVPFGQYASIHYVRDFDHYRDALVSCTFISTDVERVPLEPDDFVYADPPYDVEFRQYARNGFSWTDQERTAHCLAAHRGPVVLVNQATERIESLYRSLGYEVVFASGPRRISCTGAGNCRDPESLITSSRWPQAT